MRARQVLAAVFSLVLIGLGSDALAAKAKKKPKPKAKATASAKLKAAPKADTQAVSQLMGSFKWGMSLEEVMGVLGKQIDEKYQEKIKETRDVYLQDKYRKDAIKE